MTYCNCILNNIMIGAFIYIFRVIDLTWTRDRLMDIIVHPVRLLLSRNSLHKYQASLRVIQIREHCNQFSVSKTF
jgi:hypothetical protein